MKQILRKSVSLLLSILMIITVCSVGIISIVNAEETVTHYDLGVTDGNDVKLYDDPTGTGEKVLRINTDNTRPNFELSDPAVADGKTKFKPVAGTVYTVKFDYYLSSDSITKTFDFTLYYGGTSAYKANYNTKAGIDGVVSGRHNAFIGDNKWHTAAITFKASAKTGYLNGVANSTLPYLYLTYYTTSPIRGYIKNIEIITETATSIDVTNESYTLDKYFNEDGTPNTTKFFKGDTISTNMPDSFVNEAGEKVFVPTIDTYYASSQNNARVSDFIAVIDSSGNYLPAVSGRTYNFIIKYKVLKLNDAGTHVAIGFGRASTAAGKTVPILSKKITATSDEWQYLTGTITPNSSTKLHIYLAGTGAQIVIDHIEYTTYAANNTPWQVYNFNDNGDLHIRGQYPGTDFVVNYENEQNAAMGEHIMGWYTTPDFARGTPTTKLPDTAATLYARYPSTIIDFNVRTSYSGCGVSGTAKATTTTGIWTVTVNSNSGVMLPSYNAAISDATSLDTAPYYQFHEGKNYKISYVYKADATHKFNHTPAVDAKTSGYRDADSEQGAITFTATNDEWITKTFEFTFDINESGTKYPKIQALRGPNDDDDVFGICLRATGTSGVSHTVIFDKIIITEISDDTDPYVDPIVTLDYNDGITENQQVIIPYNTQYVLPTPNEREGYIFAGWYYNYSSATKPVDPDNVPKTVILGESKINGRTYQAQWVSTETVKVDFSESVYEKVNSKATGYNGDMGGAFSIVTDATVDDESSDNTYAYFNTTTNNIYKIALFDDNDNRLLALEGVTYKVKVRYRVDTAVNNSNIGFARCAINSYCPVAVDGGSQNMSPFASIAKVTSDFIESDEAYFTAKNMYVAIDGSDEGGDNDYRSQLCMRINKGTIYVDWFEVTPVSYAPTHIDYDTTKGTVDVDYLNKTITVIPNDGYEVSSKGVIVDMCYHEHEVVDKSIVATEIPAEALAVNNTSDGMVFTYTGDYDSDLWGALRITVDFVEEAETNTDMIAASIRTETAETETVKFKSAGIRFRSRTSTSDIEAADEVGFIVMPTKALGGKSIEEYIKANPDEKISVRAIAKDSTTDRTYTTVGSYKDYQVALTGLTNKAGTVDLRGLKLTVAMYFKTGDTVKYVEYMHSKCYNDFAK